MALALSLALPAGHADARGVRMHSRTSGSGNGGSTSSVERAEFKIDRRPMVMLRMWEGAYTEHSTGLAERYRGEDVSAQLEADLDMLYEEGWRRIMLLLPAGSPSHLVLDRTLEEYSLRSQTWRDSFSAAVRSWSRSHSDVRLGVYQGFRFRNASYPNQAQLAQYLEPWLDMGIKEFGFDFSGATTSKATFLVARDYLESRGARAFMEAYPRISQNELDMEMIKGFPVMAAKAYHDAVDPQNRWKFDPRLTEVIIQVGRTESEVDPAYLRTLVNRGMILMAFSRNPDNRAKVLEASGIIRPRDTSAIENKRENRRRFRSLRPRRVRSR